LHKEIILNSVAAILPFILLTCCNVFATSIYSQIPDSINPNANYIFYSHGYIVEGKNPKPVHPNWGEYDYPSILEALSGLDAVIISEHRAARSDPFNHATKLQTLVKQLIDVGVTPRNITLVGFSRGGFITALASSNINNPDINYVILAACTTSLLKNKDVALTGHVLSIYETSDSVGSCEEVIKRKPQAVSSFKEKAISTGEEHGAFYRPIDAWMEPLKSWFNTHGPEMPYSIPRSKIIKIEESTTGRVYPLYIQLPRSYKVSPDKKYPVIYTTDGPYSFPIVAGATRFPMNTGSMEEAIIVSVSYSAGSKGSTSRVRDYTLVKANDWKMETGNADGHLNFFKADIFAFIESKYRTNPENRIFIGNSLGGLFGAYILFKAPDTFSTYILGSPSVWFNDSYILQMEMQEVRSKTNVYLSVGSLETPEFGEREHMILGTESLAKKINSQQNASISLKLVVIEGASHATAFPTTAIQGLDWVLDNSN
jgi:predicted alpha/beta superfamily hydrolase